MSLVPAEQMFGRGQTESFLLTDAAPIIAGASIIKRGDKATSLLQYVPHVRTANETRLARLRELGFDDLAKAEKTAIPLEFARTLYPELAGESYELWNKFLPTRYSPKRFVYDSVPDEALGHIESAKKLGCFDRLEIWSPEGNDLKGRRMRARREQERRRERLVRSLDPMAVGVISDPSGTERFFSIVRWGESLAPIEQIRQYVARVDRQEARVNAVAVLSYVAFALIVFVSIGMLITGFVHGNPWAGIPGAVGAVVGIVLCWPVFLSFRARFGFVDDEFADLW